MIAITLTITEFSPGKTEVKAINDAMMGAANPGDLVIKRR